MAADEEIVWLRGESGTIRPHMLPLPKAIAHRLSKGYIRRVNEDGTPWEAPDDAEDDLASGVAPTTKPDLKASKAAWVGWAVLQGATPDDAEARTKAELIETYGN